MPVGRKASAAPAAVNNSPFTVFSHPNAYRLHNPPAVRFPVPGFDVHMEAAQAVRTVVAVAAAGAFRYNLPSAHLAGKNIAAAVCFIISFLKLFSFIFPIHGIFLLKI